MKSNKKYLLTAALLLALAAFCCKNKTPIAPETKTDTTLIGNLPEKDLGIIIEDGASDTIDLTKKIYTVHKYDGDTTVPFIISEDDEQEIKTGYYKCGFNQLSSGSSFYDRFEDMPTIMTHIIIVNDSEYRTFDFEQGSYYEGEQGYKIQEFLNLIKNIINKNPQAKNASKSDALYL